MIAVFSGIMEGLKYPTTMMMMQRQGEGKWHKTKEIMDKSQKQTNTIIHNKLTISERMVNIEQTISKVWIFLIDLFLYLIDYECFCVTRLNWKRKDYLDTFSAARLVIRPLAFLNVFWRASAFVNQLVSADVNVYIVRWTKNCFRYFEDGRGYRRSICADWLFAV